MEKEIQKLLDFFRRHKTAINKELVRAGLEEASDTREFSEMFALNPGQVGRAVEQYRDTLGEQAMLEYNQAFPNSEDMLYDAADDGTFGDMQPTSGSSGSGDSSSGSSVVLSPGGARLIMGGGNTRGVSTMSKAGAHAFDNYDGEETIIHHLINKHPHKVRQLLRQYGVHKEPSFPVVRDAMILYKRPFIDDLHKIYLIGYDHVIGGFGVPAGITGTDPGKAKWYDQAAGVLGNLAGGFAKKLLGLPDGSQSAPAPPPPPPAPSPMSKLILPIMGVVVVLAIIVMIASRGK